MARVGRPRVYQVELGDEDREALTEIVQSGREKARVIRRAHTLLLADDGRDNREIASILRAAEDTTRTTAKRYLSGGLAEALGERPRPGQKRKLDARGEAQLIALACSDAPEGRERWTLKLLADGLVALGVVASISYQTVRRVLKRGAQAMAKGAVVHSLRRPGVRESDGGSAGPLRRGTRPDASSRRIR
jgi:transposase